MPVKRSCSSAEGHMVIGIEIIHDRLQIGADRIQSLHLRAKPFEILRISDGHGFQPRRPAASFMWMTRWLRDGVHPQEDVPISGTSFYLIEQCLLVEAGEGKELLIHGIAILVIAGVPGERRPGLVENPRQHGVAAQANPWTARGPLSEIGSTKDWEKGVHYVFVECSVEGLLVADVSAARQRTSCSAGESGFRWMIQCIPF